MSETILSVDDSISIRQMVRYSLEEVGYRVLEAADGLEALLILSKNQVDLIMTDYNMPNLNGIGLIEELRQKREYKFTPILLFTTESQVKKKKEGGEAGATGWIVKPFTEGQLIKVVKKMLR